MVFKKDPYTKVTSYMSLILYGQTRRMKRLAVDLPRQPAELLPHAIRLHGTEPKKSVRPYSNLFSLFCQGIFLKISHFHSTFFKEERGGAFSSRFIVPSASGIFRRLPRSGGSVLTGQAAIQRRERRLRQRRFRDRGNPSPDRDC